MRKVKGKSTFSVEKCSIFGRCKYFLAQHNFFWHYPLAKKVKICYSMCV